MSHDIPQSPPKTYGKLQTDSPLSLYRAFVVQFRIETEVARGCGKDHVEHEVSRQSMRFASVEELLAFIERVLATVRAPPHQRVKSSKASKISSRKISKACKVTTCNDLIVCKYRNIMVYRSGN
jgi:hypothetical protein